VDARTNRIAELIERARRKDLLAGTGVFLLCASISSLIFYRGHDTVGVVFGVLFLIVGLMGAFAIVRLDGGKLVRLRARLEARPSDVVWLHWSTIPNRLRRGEGSVMVFWCDGTYARVALPKERARELFELIKSRAPNAKVTEELPLPKLLEMEGRWRKDPASFA